MDFKLLWDRIENRVHTLTAFIAGILLLLIVFISADGFFSKYIPFQYIRFTYGGVLLLWVIFWLFNHFYIPRNGKIKTGLVLCIHADTEEAEKDLKLDFINELKKQMEVESINNIFEIIVIKNHLASKYNNLNGIKKLHKRTRGHIYIFGETKKRRNGKDQYFLSLDGLVLHRPVPQQVSQELAKDFLATLPKGINFNDEFSFFGFQVSADIVSKSVKYIAGLASFISGNPFLSIKLHTNLRNQIRASQQRLPGDNVILNKIDDLLANEYAIIAHYYFGKGEQDEARKNLLLSRENNLNCYRALVLESIILFSWDNNPKQSLIVTKKCHGYDFPEWRYNEAFLYFWLSNYSSALKQCEKIKRQNYPNDFIVSSEVTEFNENILLIDSTKPVIYFWLGFNYYYKQNNLPLALKNFELFEQKADATVISLKQKSSPWLIEIRRAMNI